jgi:single-strand DNA-binding protein
MINVVVMGNLGFDPDQKEINDKPLCNLRVASAEIDGSTEWISVVCFGKDAEFAGNFLKKGDAVAISGRLRTREFTDKTGAKRSVTEVVANRVQGIGKRGNATEERPF